MFLLVKNYYLVRCSRCDIKREAKLFWGEITPQNKFCENCGASEFYIEKLDKINIIDAKYAIFIKEIANEYQTLHPETTVWVDDVDGKINDIIFAHGSRVEDHSKNFVDIKEKEAGIKNIIDYYKRYPAKLQISIADKLYLFYFLS